VFFSQKKGLTMVEITGETVAPLKENTTNQDISMDALQESEELFKATFSQAAVGIAHVDASGKWLRINRKMCDIIGYTEEEIRELTFKDITHPDDVAVSIENVRRALAGELSSYSLEKRYIHKNGAIVWANVSVSLVRKIPVNTCYFIVIVLDITPRKQTEDELNRLTEQVQGQARILDAILSASPNQIFLIDREGRYLYASGAALKSMGLESAAIIGKKWQEMGLPPETMERIDRKREEVFASKKDARGETTFSTALGIRNFEYSINLIQGTNEESTGVVITAWDITDRKRAEEEIEILYNNLLVRAFDLEAANSELEAFNYSVSHDLRKPLTIINGYCQAILELFAENLNPQCREYLHEIYDWTLRMNRLIDALLNFSRLSHCELCLETVDISMMAKSVAVELQQAETDRRVTFRIAEGIKVKGDASLLRVVLENLIGNAWKYTGNEYEAVIEFGRTQVEGKPALFVRDNGAGFDIEYSEKLFIPFQRLPGSDEFKGHGIGLATVERIIRRHGGRVWAEGDIGKGATFYFTLLNGD
jgi:PAS domain S-box-containing protein